MATYSEFTDQQLVTLLKEDDHGAFNEIYKRFFGLLYVHAFRGLNDNEESTDLLQEMFTTLWDKRKLINLKGSLSSYLYVAIRNRMLDRFEHQKVAGRYLDSLVYYSGLDSVEADHKVRELDLRRQIEKEIDALPEQMRIIFLLSRKGNLSPREIAEEMDMTEQAVRSYLKRALKILRQKLGFYSYLLCLFKLL